MRLEAMIDIEEHEYIVAVNHEAQYSKWPAGREIPVGWKLAGKNGPKKKDGLSAPQTTPPSRSG
jgi:uncharacterized protein YbdZ (MbtH family)